VVTDDVSDGFGSGNGPFYLNLNSDLTYTPAMDIKNRIFHRDTSDLTVGKRPRRVYIGIVDETGEEITCKEDTNRYHSLRCELNQQTDLLRSILQRNRRVTVCLQSALDLLNGQSPTVESLGPNKPSRPDAPNELETLEARIKKAQQRFPFKMLVSGVQELVEYTLDNKSLPGPNVVQPEILYCVQGENDHTTYDEGLGLCCGRFSNLECSKLDEEDIEFSQHIEGGSPWICITESPKRAYNQRQWKLWKGGKLTVHIIDHAILRQLGIQITRTTEPDDRGGIPWKGKSPSRKKYATDTHLLVHFWIPARCIIKIVTIDDFKNALDRLKIFIGKLTTFAIVYFSSNKTGGKEDQDKDVDKRLSWQDI
jgi:hypothetical protein